MTETKTRELEKIFYDHMSNRFWRADSARRVRTIVPIGKMWFAAIRHYEESIDKVIETFASTYRKLRPNAYEIIEAATDLDGGEYVHGKDIYAFRFYRIS